MWIPKRVFRVIAMKDARSRLHLDAGSSFLFAIQYQLALAKAAHLARGGYYEVATKQIKDFTHDSAEFPAAVDLLARINAQQEKYPEAEKLWIRALQLDPNNQSYSESLQEVERIQNYISTADPDPAVANTVLLITAITIAIFTIVFAFCL